MRDRDTPLPLVRLWRKMVPDCYEQIDRCRAAKDDGEMHWPDYCILPINAAYTYLRYSLGWTDAAAAADCAELTACWLWRQAKVIYRFDLALAETLAGQVEDVRDTDTLPTDLLMHLPYPCIYAKAPGLLECTDGFWAWIDYDINRNAPELRIQWVLDGYERSVPQVLHLLPGRSLRDCYLDTLRVTQEHMQTPVDVTDPISNMRSILSAIQLLLYLVSEGADMEDEDTGLRVVRHPPKDSKPVDKASTIAVKHVGVRIGAALRRTAATAPHCGGNTGTGGTVRPHMRRGHWHHYWTGSKADRRLVLKWTAPTMVHPEQGSDDNIVVYPVK